MCVESRQFGPSHIAKLIDDSRGSALVVFLVMLIAAGGTAAIAPFIEMGLLPVAIGAASISIVSVVTLLMTAPMTEEATDA